MNCDSCHNETATVFYSHLADGKLQKVNLCKSCAEEKGVTDPTGFSLAESLEGMGEKTQTEKTVVADELVCNACGFTQRDFKKTGRFGCAVCYRIFDEGLDGLLDAMHKHTEHRGKTPQNLVSLASVFEENRVEQANESEELPLLETSEEESPEQKLENLRVSLKASVEAEDYEEAARLRDEISQLESQLEESA